MRLRTIDEKVLEERLSKFEGRHFRLFNRLATKNLKERISNKSSLRNVNNHLKKYFDSDKALIKGVASALYSKLNRSIKYTRFDGANLGLVIDKDDVKTNYNLKNLKSFTNPAGIYDSIIFREKKIDNSWVAENATIYKSQVAHNATIKNDSGVAENATINNSGVAYDATINNSWVAENATINNSWVANNATINNSRVAESATIKNNSRVAKNSTADHSRVACNAKVRNSYIGEGVKKDSSSKIAQNIKYI